MPNINLYERISARTENVVASEIFRLAICLYQKRYAALHFQWQFIPLRFVDCSCNLRSL